MSDRGQSVWPLLKTKRRDEMSGGTVGSGEKGELSLPKLKRNKGTTEDSF